MNELDFNKKAGIILARFREEAGISQEKMAEKLGCARKTISSIENGNTPAKFHTAYEWARITGNEVETVAHELRGINMDNEDEKCLVETRNKFGTFTSDMIRAAHFVVCQKHGSNLRAFLHLSAMYAQLPLKYKQTITQLVKDLYEMADVHGELACPDDFRPDYDLVSAAQQAGKESAFQNKHKYELEN